MSFSLISGFSCSTPASPPEACTLQLSKWKYMDTHPPRVKEKSIPTCNPGSSPGSDTLLCDTGQGGYLSGPQFSYQ